MKKIYLTLNLYSAFKKNVRCRICDKVFDVGDTLIRTGKPKNPKFYCLDHYYAESKPIKSKSKNVFKKIKDKILDFNFIPSMNMEGEIISNNVDVSFQELGLSRLFLKYDEREIAYYKRLGIDNRPNIRKGID